MKKQKKPIFLGAVFILLLAVVFAFNFSTFSASDPQPAPTKPAENKAATKAADEAKLHETPQQLEGDKSHDEVKSMGSGVLQHDEDDDMTTNVKYHNYIDPNAPKIMAPPPTKNTKQITPDQGSVNSQGQWYAPESGVK